MHSQFKSEAEKIPYLLYGTAWKEDETASLTKLALKTGFIGIDTANQRKHYFEQGVGEGLQTYLTESSKKREDLFIQTKFTYEQAQDHRLPYNPTDSFEKQVRQSLTSSLAHLHIDYLDSYLLHGPEKNYGISDTDLEIWHAMEDLVSESKTRFIGISNVTIEQLKELYSQVRIKPKFVQNRCFASSGWDKEVRTFCQNQAIIYQGFSLLTANQRHLTHKNIDVLVRKYGKTKAQIVFRFALEVGILPLTGTSNELHMKQDLAIHDFSLNNEELESLEKIAIAPI